MQIILGSFICSLCSVVCSIILQRILGLFLLQNLYLQPFVQSAEFKIYESALEPCGHRWTISFRYFLYYKHMEFYHLFPYNCLRKSCDLLFTQTASTAQPYRISQIVYTAHIIILLFNNPADTLWKKTFTSCLGS